jgi:uncharacterized protein involved in exopolysaccharide biosynthesis
MIADMSCFTPFCTGFFVVLLSFKELNRLKDIISSIARVADKSTPQHERDAWVKAQVEEYRKMNQGVAAIRESVRESKAVLAKFRPGVVMVGEVDQNLLAEAQKIDEEKKRAEAEAKAAEEKKRADKGDLAEEQLRADAKVVADDLVKGLKAVGADMDALVADTYGAGW